MPAQVDTPAGEDQLRAADHSALTDSHISVAANVLSWLGAALFLGAAATALAEPADDASPQHLEDVVVSATRAPERSFDLPVSIDRVEGRTLRDGQLAVNLSESLGAVPGLSVQNRQNYAQDLQISVRGFGARSSFGVRGVRLYADGIPGTMPDGQGQFSHFDLGSADHIEVLRGPFSALYGNSSGGVISLFTENGQPGFGVVGTAATGSLGTQRYGLKASGASGGTDYLVSAAHFETDGYRDHSRAERNTANLKVRIALDDRSTLTLVANAIETPDVQDPLGLTRSQLEADPTQAGTGALLYNTRKSLQQEQAGATLTSALTEADDVAIMIYAGRRSTTQFLAILRAVEAANPLHPGGVVDLDREYRGGDVHITDRRTPGGMPLTLTAGVTYDVLEEARRGFVNYAGSELGVIGALRRDDLNHVGAIDEYLQLEWDPAARWRAIAGLRHSDIDVTSRDRAGTQPQSDIQYSAANPVAGVTYRVSPALNAYASYGRGFETPTLNELAYRSTDGTQPGLNDGLLPARSDNYELGLKAEAGRLRANLAAFYIATRDELAVQANAGGRSVYENIGQTERRGAELALAAGWDNGLDARLAYTYMHAATTAPYQSCAGLPCAPVVIAAGSHLPGVPANALYAGVTWRTAPLGFSATIETVGRSQIYVDDRNSDAAAGYWTTNLRAGFTQRGDGWTVDETARLDDIADRRYVGSVIVNESNRRYFEPDPGRTAYFLVSVAYR
jgi:iron complex outermembrane recepter protein